MSLLSHLVLPIMLFNHLDRTTGILRYDVSGELMLVHQPVDGCMSEACQAQRLSKFILERDAIFPNKMMVIHRDKGWDACIFA